jgi:hypothetical protein
MERGRTFIFLIGVLLAGSGCGQSEGSGAAGSGTPALDPLDAIPRYAVVSTDFTSSSIAVLDQSFQVLHESWINSGTTYPGLVATLSGDVVLPTRQAGDGTLTLIDRFFMDVVTRFFVPSGDLNGQARTQGEAGDNGFSSNPQDFVYVSPDSAWVPRYEPNLDPAASPLNRGNDLFEIDPTEMVATGSRIDLSPLDTVVQVMGPSGPVEVRVFARPSRSLLIGSRILVGLDRISASFDVAGPGMVAVVDLEEDSVEGVELPGLKSCGNVAVVPGAPSKVLVSCAGFSQPFGDEAQIRESAGIVLLDASEPEVKIDRVWRAADHPDGAIAVGGVIALDEERVLGVASGDFASSVDTLYAIDLTTGAQEPVYQAAGSFVIGFSAYDPESEMVFVPDAASNAIIELALDQDELIEVGSTAIAAGLGLPPTQVYLLD